MLGKKKKYSCHISYPVSGTLLSHHFGDKETSVFRDRLYTAETDSSCCLLFMKFETAATQLSINLFHCSAHLCVTSPVAADGGGCEFTPTFNRHRITAGLRTDWRAVQSDCRPTSRKIGTL